MLPPLPAGQLADELAEIAKKRIELAPSIASRRRTSLEIE
jgi:hypothetical protein